MGKNKGKTKNKNDSDDDNDGDNSGEEGNSSSQKRCNLFRVGRTKTASKRKILIIYLYNTYLEQGD